MAEGPGSEQDASLIGPEWLSADWADVGVAVLAAVLALVNFLWIRQKRNEDKVELERQRKEDKAELERQRKREQAKDIFQRQVSLALEERLRGLNELSVKIQIATRQVAPDKRVAMIYSIFYDDYVRAFELIDGVIASAKSWSNNDILLEGTYELRQYVRDDLSRLLDTDIDPHYISELAQGLKRRIAEFKEACERWLREIEEDLSSGKLAPPSPSGTNDHPGEDQVGRPSIGYAGSL